jgi:hypothetical protein
VSVGAHKALINASGADPSFVVPDKKNGPRDGGPSVDLRSRRRRHGPPRKKIPRLPNTYADSNTMMNMNTTTSSGGTMIA